MKLRNKIRNNRRSNYIKYSQNENTRNSNNQTETFVVFEKMSFFSHYCTSELSFCKEKDSECV